MLPQKWRPLIDVMVREGWLRSGKFGRSRPACVRPTLWPERIYTSRTSATRSARLSFLFCKIPTPFFVSSAHDSSPITPAKRRVKPTGKQQQPTRLYPSLGRAGALAAASSQRQRAQLIREFLAVFREAVSSRSPNHSRQTVCAVTYRHRKCRNSSST